MADPHKERIARNETAFRELNETLESRVHRDRERIAFAGFVCECGDRDCDATIRLELSSYEEIRSDPLLFFLVPGHETRDAEDVVRRGAGYLVVRKHEDVAEIAEDRHRGT